jgi:hypothetical protein
MPREPGKKPSVSYKIANGILCPGVHLIDAIVEKDACLFGEDVRQKAERRGSRGPQGYTCSGQESDRRVKALMAPREGERPGIA